MRAAYLSGAHVHSLEKRNTYSLSKMPKNLKTSFIILLHVSEHRKGSLL